MGLSIEPDEAYKLRDVCPSPFAHKSKHLPSHKLKKMFRRFGKITPHSCVINRVPEGDGYVQFGFVSFKQPEDAASAIIEMHNKIVDGSRITVCIKINEQPHQREMIEQCMRKQEKS